MKSLYSSPKIVKGGTILLAGSVVFLLVLGISNKTLKGNLNKEKLTSEKLLADKLSLDKDVVRLNNDVDHFKLELSGLAEKNSELSKAVSETQAALTRKQQELDKAMKSNAGKKVIEKEYFELKRMKEDFQNQLTGLNKKVSELNSENAGLSAEKRSLLARVADLENKNKELTENNRLLKAMVADDYLLMGLKARKDKITWVARRTDKISLSFDIPEDANENLGFAIIEPGGNRIEPGDKTISTSVQKSETDQVVNSGEGAPNLNKRVNMEYNPKGKLRKGIYKIEIFNNNEYISSCQVKLK